MLGRRLLVKDNLMQMCIHGGTINYGKDLPLAQGIKFE